MKYTSTGPNDTRQLGFFLGQHAFPGEVVSLTGDLGAGKTVFAKGFAEGLGIPDSVTSPTFTIMQVYESGRLPLYHFDVYRIEEPEEMEEIGYEDCFYGNGVSLVEWADRVPELLPDGTVFVEILPDPEYRQDTRIIDIRASEPRFIYPDERNAR